MNVGVVIGAACTDGVGVEYDVGKFPHGCGRIGIDPDETAALQGDTSVWVYRFGANGIIGECEVGKIADGRCAATIDGGNEQAAVMRLCQRYAIIRKMQVRRVSPETPACCSSSGAMKGPLLVISVAAPLALPMTRLSTETFTVLLAVTSVTFGTLMKSTMSLLTALSTTERKLLGFPLTSPGSVTEAALAKPIGCTMQSTTSRQHTTRHGAVKHVKREYKKRK